MVLKAQVLKVHEHALKTMTLYSVVLDSCVTIMVIQVMS